MFQKGEYVIYVPFIHTKFPAVIIDENGSGYDIRVFSYEKENILYSDLMGVRGDLLLKVDDLVLQA